VTDAVCPTKKVFHATTDDAIRSYPGRNCLFAAAVDPV